MKSPAEFLGYLRSLDIEIWTEGENLRIRAPKDTLTPDLRAQLTERKSGILDFLRQVDLLQKSRLSPIQPLQGGDDRFPLSFAQQRLWILAQLEGPSSTYNIPIALRLNGSLNVAALQKSLTEIVKCHKVLGAVFEAVDGAPHQVVIPLEEIPLPIIDLRHIPEEERYSEAMLLVEEEARKLVDLTRWPLFWAKLIRLSPVDHIFSINMHHIVSDEWSLNVFFRELSERYQSCISGDSASFPELPIQYFDFAAWQREWLKGAALDLQVDYWKKKLGDDLPILVFPTDHPRPHVQTFHGADYRFMLPNSLLEELKALGRRQNATLFMTMLAAFNVLLYRYTNQTDILLGVPVANRTRPETENLIGFFVNTLVMRTDLSGNPTFLKLLERARETALGAYANQDLPFEVLVDTLHPKRDLSRQPLFQVMLALQSAPENPVLSGLQVEALETTSKTSKFDLTLFLEETPQGLSAIFEYNVDLFDETAIARLARNFQSLLESIVASPEQHIARLDLLAEAEEQTLISWNDTQVNFPGDRFIHQIFEDQVEITPDAPAVIFGGESLTYRELNSRANQLARHLNQMGVGLESRVGVCMERSLEMVIALYGIIKSGAAYVPMDPTYPRDRLAFMLEDAQTPVLLTQAKLASTLPAHKAQVICLDGDWEQIARQEDDNLPSLVSDDSLVYIIYTSGSTGKPKGAMNTHKGILNRLQWMQEAYQLKSDDRVMQKTPFSFDVSVWEFFWPMLIGACLVVAEPEGHKDSAYLARLINEQRITTLHFVPSMLQVFLEEETLGNCNSLLRVICSGEALPAETQQRFFARMPEHVDLHNLYGPTEAAVDVTYWTCQRQDQRINVPIGKPIANIQIHLLDAYLQRVPIGVSAELYISGVGLARGYLNRPDLTAEKFIPDPFSRVPGQRMYKTGDLARYLPDGNIEYLGRLDDQVKIRGFRIELGEIEFILRQHPSISEVAVVVRDMKELSNGKHLVAYFTLTADASARDSVDIPDLRTYLKEHLPEYMIPSFFVRLNAMPLTPNGKTDRKALPDQDYTAFKDDSFVSPRTETERIIADIWAQILGVNWVGINDDFFALGGNSLLSVRLIAKINQLGLQLSLREFLEHTTIASLAGIIRPSVMGKSDDYLTGKRSLEASKSSVLLLQPQGKKPPLFFIHPSGGSALCYVNLARILKKDQPSYGLEAIGLYDEKPLDTDVQKMAARYVAAIQGIAPQGPYYLAGWSFGGVVSFEMAQQLTSQGHEVVFLGMIDTLSPTQKNKMNESVVMMRFVHWIERFYNTKLNLSLADMQQIKTSEQMQFVLEKMQEEGLDISNLEFIAQSRMIVASIVQGKAEDRYIPGTYPGKITVFRAKDVDPDRQSDLTHPDFQSPDWGWSKYANQPAEVFVVPGRHSVILEQPFVQGLAEKIEACLEKILTSANSHYRVSHNLLK
jgi:amino acid adenylation domain-containing protein